MKFIIATALLALSALPALAQEPKPDCKNPITQMEMTYCEEQEFGAADRILNAEYQKARKVMKKWDAGAEVGSKGAEDALVKAQRAWVAYRDAQCASYGYQAHGGTMEPQLIYGCQADLTRKRTAELKQLTEIMGN
ncbi:lysozyme inhibitor LprI family protein [Neorhizobium alkalisoli]|uniref:lysozyme inhibitor LprI family protein n=1 Tax=Neorhizobium alkalisoli TaxID=528178 RepID=UPI001FE1E90E|nr:lysozyme inhibitor LprI family protein [Neorhizobium alkalisoli]